jgi:hypothetical protein
MAREWLNHHVYQAGQWTAGQPMHLESWNEVTFTDAAGRDLRIHETARSGSVTLSPTGGSLVAFGDAEVYLTAYFAAGGFQYRSAPINQAIRINGVRTLRLSLLIPIGNAGCPSVNYMAIVNAHCVYERL